MLTALLVLCAVAADAAPLAAKSATAADPELTTLLTSQSLASPAVLTSPEVKVNKLKKFHASGHDLESGKKLHAAPEKLGDVTTEQMPATSITTSAPTTAPLAAVEESSPLPERDVELLKAHIAPPFVATAMFEDEKASRFRHSTLFGFSSFF